jgi:hypothetical protein
VRFYSDADGNKPVVTFLEDLRRKNSILHRLVVTGIRKLEMTERHGPPLTELVDKKYKIFELPTKCAMSLLKSSLCLEERKRFRTGQGSSERGKKQRDREPKRQKRSKSQQKRL